MSWLLLFWVARASTSSSLKILRKEGFSRVRVDGVVRELDEEITLGKTLKHDIRWLSTVIVIRPDSLGRIV